MAMATGPTFKPRTFVLSGAESGSELTPSFFPVARMGSPLRACTVGQTVPYSGTNSFVRGGGAATGHTWKVYEYNSSLTDETYLASRGALVTTVVGTTFDFTPATPGTYAIELHLSGAVESDGIASPLGFGYRFLKVFAAGGYDLEGIPALNGPNGSLDDGGVTLDLSYKRPDNLSGRQIINHLMRVVVNHRLYYATATGPFEEYTWQPGAPYYDPEILFSGFISGSTIREDAETHEVSYQLAGAQLPLTLAQMPLRYVTGVIDGQPFGTFVPPTFFDEVLWILVKGADATDDPEWVHTVTNLVASDPLLHVLQRHTNLIDAMDFPLDQRDTDTIATSAAQVGAIGDWLRAMQAGRFGRLWTDRKSAIYCGPDDDLISSPFKPAPVIDLDAELFLSIRIGHAYSAVGQVMVESGDTLMADPGGVKNVGKDPVTAELIEQKVRTVSYTSTYPTLAQPGARRTYQAPRYNTQASIDALAIRLFNRDNVAFPDIEIDFQMFPHLDLGQPLTLAFDPRTEEPVIQTLISVSGDGPLRCYVVGYTNQIAPDGTAWKTTVRFRQSANV